MLAGFLQQPGATVVDRLAALMGASRSQRTAMAGLFASGAVVIGLVGTAVAGGGGMTSRSALVRGPLHDSIGRPGVHVDGSDHVAGAVVRLLTDESRLAAMTAAAAAVGHRDAARRVAEVVLDVAHHGRKARR